MELTIYELSMYSIHGTPCGVMSKFCYSNFFFKDLPNRWSLANLILWPNFASELLMELRANSLSSIFFEMELRGKKTEFHCLEKVIQPITELGSVEGALLGCLEKFYETGPEYIGLIPG